MKKIVVIPDSFKGTLTSKEIVKSFQAVFNEKRPDIFVLGIMIADGGEGSLDAFKSTTKLKEKEIFVLDSNFKEIKSVYGLGKNFAIIELAKSSGLYLTKNNNPLYTTTYGVGQFILDSLDNKTKDITLCIGGSATNDAGCGMAAALGVKFFGFDKKEFIPVGKTLCNIEKIDISNIDKRIKNINITCMCDVDNQLFGKNGAAYVFAPQKGASKEDVEILDKGLIHFSNLIKDIFGVDLSLVKGGGSAGGFGAGALFFLGAKLKPGISVILDKVKFEDKIKDADLIITGEGRIDSQTLNGKVIMGVLKKSKSIPVIAICGSQEKDIFDKLKKYNLKQIININEKELNPDEYKKYAKINLHKTVFKICENIDKIF